MKAHSVIWLCERDVNRTRKFGSAQDYIPATIVTLDDTPFPALFTDDQVRDALERARRNPEDAVTPPGYVAGILLAVMGGARRGIVMERIAGAVLVLCLALVAVGAWLLWPTSAHGSEVDHLFADGFESPALPIDPCLAALPPNLQPVYQQWPQAFSSSNNRFRGHYPESPPAPVAIGAEKNGLLVVWFIAAEGHVQITWDQAQPNGAYGYGTPRVTNGGMFIGLGPCLAGDLRPINNQGADPFERGACRTVNTAGALTYSSSLSAGTVCKVEAGRPYAITVSPRNPNADDYVETCNNEAFTGCDVQIVSRGLGTRELLEAARVKP